MSGSYKATHSKPPNAHKVGLDSCGFWRAAPDFYIKEPRQEVQKAVQKARITSPPPTHMKTLAKPQKYVVFELSPDHSYEESAQIGVPQLSEAFEQAIHVRPPSTHIKPPARGVCPRFLI
jgi:hypothetical protein